MRNDRYSCLPAQKAANEEDHQGVEIVGQRVHHIAKKKHDAAEQQRSEVGPIGPRAEIDRGEDLRGGHGPDDDAAHRGGGAEAGGVVVGGRDDEVGVDHVQEGVHQVQHQGYEMVLVWLDVFDL